MSQQLQEPHLNRASAMRFIIFMGVVSLFADITYEGARSISGPYLAMLGATGAIVGFVAGFGEFISFALRPLSGYITDRTRSYWGVAIFGYVVNLIAVPLLAFTRHWPAAAALLMIERFGKAVRVPPRDAMLSYATQSIGRGWGFGIHEALDRIGALLGPLFLSAVLFTAIVIHWVSAAWSFLPYARSPFFFYPANFIPTPKTWKSPFHRSNLKV